MQARNETRKYQFGVLQFAVRNWKGLFVMSEGLKAKIAALSVEDAKAANSAAWKMKRDCAKGMNRYANATLYPGMYDDFSGPYGVADAVAKETWKNMRNG